MLLYISGEGERRSDSNKICLFCLEEDRAVVFKPCRHLCCCHNCLPNFKNKPCPICRTPIQGSQVVFLS
ncbi:hypothetical protein LOTGIDRAFT_146942 [Lottia gigantea]|uniref:RING-type domain-containing protein n=1 Tax=Lottia gigantea TaxID=225164 RepID=V4A9S7_LOTGI|nr:hypothetical protein LOTGIDRAFT_146942 [Lottia gigantea]ESP00744.1 hypothetical protein LOTGIDRAFT_146942 [Lottia gigantea]